MQQPARRLRSQALCRCRRKQLLQSLLPPLRPLMESSILLGECALCVLLPVRNTLANFREESLKWHEMRHLVRLRQFRIPVAFGGGRVQAHEFVRLTS